MPLRVLVVDDHTLIRQAFVTIFSSDEAIQVVGEASNGLEAVARARELKPDVVLMDVYMPQLDGLAATRILTQELPAVAIIAMSAAPPDEHAAAAMEAGARGYIDKAADHSSLVKRLKELAAAPAAPRFDSSAPPENREGTAASPARRKRPVRTKRSQKRGVAVGQRRHAEP